ncbi:Macrolide export ATP-binding/permease protein MacB [Methanoculleus chikugoensis]|uniref:Macrolide export ATP-binding/permease protein MacB n=1 Tax=Methanoculleus chikugoensis TaxID=118126 RepID=A0A1M4MHA1_9EURY|nr:ABC transporter permease [Methanoculleus chikugoensis]SCL74277.1 Macrolide export ATP-binding/permease protein MacB [Methanoculleus chikugoensis]
MIGNDIIFALSIRSVRLHFLRSVLAALGIVIGVVAIASIGMMGANMTLSVTEELSDMANKLTVTAYRGGGGGMMGGPGGGGNGGSSDDDAITEKEFKTIQRIVAKYGTTYTVMSESDRIEVGSKEGRATIYGLDAEIIRGILTVETGEYPKSTTSVVVGPTLAERLDLKIGSKIDIGDPDDGSTATVRVVGILEERGMSMDLSTDMAIVGTQKLFTGIYGGESEYDQVNVVVNDLNDIDAVTEAIEDELNRKEDTVTVQDSSRMMESITSTVSTMTTFVMAIAGISLLVAAVSIFNVMMMSVNERVREIGILRSIGTQRTEILRMFIYEAGILGLVGAVIGAIASIVIGYIVVLGMVGTAEYFFAPGSVVYVPMAMAVGAAICIITGVYPAWRASNLDPIEALRAE